MVLRDVGRGRTAVAENRVLGKSTTAGLRASRSRRRISVIVPKPVIEDEASLAISSLAISIVDTKGIDGTAERDDLEFHLNDPRTITVLCSRFQRCPIKLCSEVAGQSHRGTVPRRGIEVRRP